ncbi:MAG: hypothetical protein J1F12_01550 [Muribaculaceae bacterium]|nr:hypothetical protein [Muribaculaceae bacterium]
MIKKHIDGYDCHCVPFEGADTVAYMIYPQLAELEDKWLQRMSELHKVNLVAVYVPADQWNDALTPWPEPGEAKGCPPFAGESRNFLKLFQEKIIPLTDRAFNLKGVIHRDLIGVSLGGLFTLWQWMMCDTFRSIASLSGSFWYVGFLEWFEKQSVPPKKGKAFFLLGEEEPASHVEAFRSVGVNTEKIVAIFKEAGIDTTFEWVPGNHFSRPVHRAEKALEALYPA